MLQQYSHKKNYVIKSFTDFQNILPQMTQQKIVVNCKKTTCKVGVKVSMNRQIGLHWSLNNRYYIDLH